MPSNSPSGSMETATAGAVDRRTFVKASLAAGISVIMRPLAAVGQPAVPGAEPAKSYAWQRTPATAARRIDGWQKVTGAKIYAADFRAADMPGWPRDTAHALLIKTPDATRVFEGIDLAALDKELAPDRVVLASDLVAAAITVPPFYAGDLLCPAGKTPLYLGQPLALLIWNDVARFALARQAIKSASGIIRFGAKTGPVEAPPYASARFVRVAGPAPGADDVYSAMRAGWTFPILYQKDDRPAWAVPSASGSDAQRASYYGDQIRKEIDAGGAGRFVLERTFRTQSIDQVFMEPEAGLAWYDSGKRRLELVLGVQSPQEAAGNIAQLVAKNAAAQRVTDIVAHCAEVGGAFGGKDHTIYPLYVALAGLFSPNRPVRLANDRYDQFQFGLKRHALTAKSRMAVDRASGRIAAFVSDQDLDGGGLANLSPAVAFVGATASIGIYDVPKVDVTTEVRHSRAVTAGSMRGFGALQTMTALEVMIDEAAAGLGRDPIAFRKTNLLATGGKTMVGNVISGDLRSGEVLDRLAVQPIWTGRAAEKTRRAAMAPGKAFGVGLACVSTVFGSGSDPAFALVEVDPAGRITVTSQAVEIGTGVSTALAVRVADRLGIAAHKVNLGVLDGWDVLGLTAPDNPFTLTRAQQEEGAKNPRWVPDIAQDTTASISAHVHTAVAAEAANVILRFGLWPAAQAIWSPGRAAKKALRVEDVRFVGGRLVADGMEPLTLPRVAAQAHKMGLVVAAMVHGYNRWAWARAAFDLSGVHYTGAIDALAVRYGSGASPARKAAMTTRGYQRFDRVSVTFPPTLFERIAVGYTSACGSVVAVEVDRATGAVSIVDAATVLECGRALVPEQVAGQAEGGFAMGAGYALYENLPLYEDGPGNGSWNLDRYRVPRASDLAVWNLKLDVLAPLGPTDVPKGMGEVVMIPVVPAILNAIADATGTRFYELPVTAEKIRAALR
jgi:CO/xanthine dehydrogenase Mo-binding subunit